MSWTDLLPMLVTGGVLIVIELARSVPAWLRVRRTRRCDGISPASVGVLAGTSAGWVAVAVITDSPAAAVATVLWLVFHLLLMKEVVRVRPAATRVIIHTIVLSLLGMAAAAVVGAVVGDIATTLGIATGFASAAYSLPALISGMISKSTAGLSIISLTVNALEGAIYFVAGMGLGGIAPSGRYIVAYLSFGGIALASNVPRLIRTLLRRLTGKDESATHAAYPRAIDVS